MFKKMNKKGGLAISQILILVVGIIAIAYALGSGVGEVSAFGPGRSFIQEVGGSATTALAIPSAPPVSILETLRAAGGGGAGGAETAGTIVTSVAPAGVGTSLLTSLMQIGVHAGIAAGLYWFIGTAIPGVFPSWDADFFETLGLGVGLGWGIGSIGTTGLFTLLNLLGVTSVSTGPIGWIAGGIGAVVGGIIAIVLYKKQAQESVIFNCYPWAPEAGGKDCDKCGEEELPCSKYECNSLGQSCELLNEGTDEELCTWVNRNDIDPPIIEAWGEILTEGYEYTPADAILPPDKGVIIAPNTGDCIPPFTPITFGIELDKPARCKIEPVRKDSFEEMDDNYFSDRASLYSHSVFTTFPSAESLEEEGIILENGGEHELYVRCISENGYANTGNFVFKLCVDQEPDTTAPRIIIADPLNEMPVSQGTLEQEVTLYVNEPADCRWDHLDKDYDTMSGSMTCKSGVTEKNALMLYECEGLLDGLSDGVENTFYFRCKDSLGNMRSESYEYKLVGTRPLVIDSVGPEGIIKGSSNSIKVTLQARTSAGYDEGAANCYYNEKCYNENGNTDNYVLFRYETGVELFSQYQHSQDLWLSEGDYECSIKCFDLGGNSEIKTTTFDVETDFGSPLVSRAYYEGGDLNLITSEPASCVYDTTSCSYLFEDGISITSSDDITHSMTWNTNDNLYIKCQDEYENPPPPGECSIILRPFEFF